MRILCKRELRKKVPYSPQHVARLEKAGAFPQRVKLGKCRVGWLESEIDDWIAERVAEREPLPSEDA
jgi:prophage regulatory protein